MHVRCCFVSFRPVSARILLLGQMIVAVLLYLLCSRDTQPNNTQTTSENKASSLLANDINNTMLIHDRDTATTALRRVTYDSRVRACFVLQRSPFWRASLLWLRPVHEFDICPRIVFVIYRYIFVSATSKMLLKIAVLVVLAMASVAVAAEKTPPTPDG